MHNKMRGNSKWYTRKYLLAKKELIEEMKS